MTFLFGCLSPCPPPPPLSCVPSLNKTTNGSNLCNSRGFLMIIAFRLLVQEEVGCVSAHWIATTSADDYVVPWLCRAASKARGFYPGAHRRASLCSLHSGPGCRCQPSWLLVRPAHPFFVIHRQDQYCRLSNAYISPCMCMRARVCLCLK